MNWLDIVILAALVAGTVNGLGQGLVRQVLSLAGFVVGFSIASQRYQDLAGYLGFIGDPNWANVISFALITIVISALAAIAGDWVHKMVNFLLFGCFDRILGGAFGIVQTTLFVEIALILLAKYPIMGLGTTIRSSSLASAFLTFAPLLLGMLPPEFDVVRKFLQ